MRIGHRTGILRLRVLMVDILSYGEENILNESDFPLSQTLKYLLKRLLASSSLLYNENVNLSCNNFYFGCILVCVDCILVSPRIDQADPDRQTFSLRWFCHTC
jgi:hypothetical protein